MEYFWQKFPLQSACNARGRQSKTCLPWMKATLTSRLQHWVIHPRSFQRWDGSSACQSISQSRAILPYPGQGKWKTYHSNATWPKRTNGKSDIIVSRCIIEKIKWVKYPTAGVDVLTQNLQQRIYSRAGRTWPGVPGYHQHYANWQWNHVDCHHTVRLKAVALSHQKAYYAVSASFSRSWESKEQGSYHIYHQDICSKNNIIRNMCNDKFKCFNKHKLTCPWNS